MSAPVHFLHIRKTGGMALKAALSPVAAERGLLLREHGTALAKVPKGERAVFVVRDPVARFVSGFNIARYRNQASFNSISYRFLKNWQQHSHSLETDPTFAPIVRTEPRTESSMSASGIRTSVAVRKISSDGTVTRRWYSFRYR